MKRTIRLRESELRRMISESIRSVLKEDEELDYDMRELKKALQKQYGTYHATSQNGDFQTGDRVIVHSKRMGDIEGIIEDFGTHLMTWEETADVIFMKDGREMTLAGVPLSKITKID